MRKEYFYRLLLLGILSLLAWTTQSSSIAQEPLKQGISRTTENNELVDLWDAEKVRARTPILIAHRGGVVGPAIPECSRMAVKMAATYRYDMVELDVQESINFLGSEETITSLDSMLKLCRSLGLGIMFDIKQGERSDVFFKRILNLIDTHDLNRACMTLGDTQVKERLKGRVLLTLSEESGLFWQAEAQGKRRLIDFK